MNLQQLKASYEKLWSTCEITPSRMKEVTEVAERLIESKAKLTYLNVENLTGVPWWVVAIVHEREASQEWWANLANGQPWNKVTTKVPKGRGPFKSWLDAAVDALKNAPPYFARNKDWSAGGVLIGLVQYNGLAYEFKHDEWSPYIWAATNHEERGKYVTDGHFDPTVWDMQLGAAAMLKRMRELDPSIQFGGSASPTPLPPPKPEGHYEWQASRLVWVVHEAGDGGG